MAAEHAEIIQAACRRFANNQCRGRCGGFETDGEEHHLPFRVRFGDFQCIQRRINHADIGAMGLCAEQGKPFRRRHAQGVAVAAQDCSVFQGQLHRQVDASNRQHADRAAGAVDHAHVVGQQLADPIAGNRMGVAAAELHEPVGAVWMGFFADACGDALSQLAVAVFIDVLHEASRCVRFNSSNMSSVRWASSGSIRPRA